MTAHLLLLALRLRVKEGNAGVCLIWICPECEEARDYYLIASSGNFVLIDEEFSKPVDMLDLRCSECGYEIRVDAAEKVFVDEAVRATRLFQEGGLSPEDYL